ncbi:MAG: metal ABC transporter ATP-binding protein [Tissierellia bacterium]|nr:metal ABC transporter ATP-binding protein [Tissierellia bacterium]
MEEKSKIYEVDNLCFSYGKTTVLDDANLCLNQGDFAALIGSNGAGKTTFIKLLLGILSPQEGRVLFKGRDVSGMGYSNKVRYVPQLVSGRTDFPISVMELVASGLLPEKFSKEEQRSRTRDILSLVGLQGKEEELYGSLSGGQRQRALIARAMISMPEVLLMDEPTSGIDAPSTQELWDLLRHLNEVHGITIFIISHDMHRLAQGGAEIYLLEDGKIREGGLHGNF